jgi:hypothetical protein
LTLTSANPVYPAGGAQGSWAGFGLETLTILKAIHTLLQDEGLSPSGLPDVFLLRTRWKGPRMKPLSWIVTFGMAALTWGVSATAQTPSVLEPKIERHEGPPLWISAAAVSDKEKIIDLDMIDSDTLRMRVEKQRAELGNGNSADKSLERGKLKITKISPSECKSESYLEDYRAGHPSTSLSTLAAESKAIVRGKIRTIEMGFSFGTPSSLLGVDVVEVLRGSAPPKSPLYVDYPVARFKIGPFYFCNATKGFEPQPGDEVLLFDVAGPTDRTGVLYVPRMDQIFFQNRSGVLFPPPSLKNTEDLKAAERLTDVVGRLRAKGLITSGEAASSGSIVTFNPTTASSPIRCG